MPKILVTYHSFTGKTKELAEAAARGAESAGADVVLKEVVATTTQDVAGADAILVATPQTFGAMAGDTKKLFERLWQHRQQIAPGKRFAVIVCHSSGPEATLDLMEKFTTYFGFTKVGGIANGPRGRVREWQSRLSEVGRRSGSGGLAKLPTGWGGWNPWTPGHRPYRYTSLVADLGSATRDDNRRRHEDQT